MAKPIPLEPIAQAAHLCIDMQNIFASGGVWPTPWMEPVLLGIVRLVERNPARTVFTRFIATASAEDRPALAEIFHPVGPATVFPTGTVDRLCIVQAVELRRTKCLYYFFGPFRPSSLSVAAST